VATNFVSHPIAIELRLDHPDVGDSELLPKGDLLNERKRPGALLVDRDAGMYREGHEDNRVSNATCLRELARSRLKSP
jgi:hypothetical protein